MWYVLELGFPRGLALGVKRVCVCMCIVHIFHTSIYLVPHTPSHKYDIYIYPLFQSLIHLYLLTDHGKLKTHMHMHMHEHT